AAPAGWGSRGASVAASTLAERKRVARRSRAGSRASQSTWARWAYRGGAPLEKSKISTAHAGVPAYSRGRAAALGPALRSSLLAQGGEGIYAAGAAGGEVTSGARHRDKDGGGPEQRSRVVVGQAEQIELAGGGLGAGNGGGDADDHADDDHQQRLSQDHSDDGAGTGAEGHADSDLGSAAGNAVGHDAVKADGGQQQGQEAEEGAELGQQLLGDEGAANHRVHVADCAHLDVGVEVADGLADAGDGGTAAGADENVGAAVVVAGDAVEAGQIKAGRSLLGQVVVFGIGADPDDRVRRALIVWV